MKPAAKHWIIYADGRIRESKDPLVGALLIEPHNGPDGNEQWQRKFKIQIARDEPDMTGPEPGHPKNFTMVALEVENVRHRNAAETAQWHAEVRARLDETSRQMSREWRARREGDE